MPRKTTQLIEALMRAPMKASHARNFAGNAQFAKLVKKGCIETYQDINHEYAESTGGQKPICQWVKLGHVEYVEAQWGKKKDVHAHIAKATQLLEAHGYSVLPPDDP